jgi:hypothetical protein
VSLRQAINAKCRECIYDPLSGLGTWRQQVSGCAVYSCPLWADRPVATAMPDGTPPPRTPDESRAWWGRNEATADHSSGAL